MPRPFEQPDRPAAVFKYAVLSAYSLDSLRKSSFWFSDHDKLNDPYDCRFKYDDSLFDRIGMPKQHRPYLAKLWGWGVCCFTTDNRNPLMWSHYADGHKGFCLEFDTQKCKLLSEKLFPVTYSDEYPIIKDFSEIIPKGVLQKTCHWQYEKEWRLIIAGGGDCHLPYERRALKAIYFGLKTPSEKILEVVTVCNESHYQKLKFFKAIGEEDNYSLTYQDVSVEKTVSISKA